MMSPGSYLSLAHSAGISPATRAGLKKLLQSQSGGAIAAPALEAQAASDTDALDPTTGPASSWGASSIGRALLADPAPAPPEKARALGRALLGDAEPAPSDPTTGPDSSSWGASSIGHALLADPADPAPDSSRGGSSFGRTSVADLAAAPEEAPRTRIPTFSETVGGKRALELLERQKGLSWLAPDFMANRLERDIAQALDLARAEISGAHTQESASQELIDREDRKLEASRKQQREEAEAEAARQRAEREADAAKLKEELERARLGLETRKVSLDERDASERQAYRARLLEARNAQREMEEKTASPVNPLASDPAATGPFRKFAEELITKNPTMAPKDVTRAQVNASRAGVLPPMMSTPRDRPPTATGPDGTKVYWNGSAWVPMGAQ